MKMDRVASDPLMGLLACPNPACGGADMRDMLVGHLLLHGNAYVEMVGQETVEALYVLPPTHMRLVRDATGWPVTMNMREVVKYTAMTLARFRPLST